MWFDGKGKYCFFNAEKHVFSENRTRIEPDQKNNPEKPHNNALFGILATIRTLLWQAFFTCFQVFLAHFRGTLSAFSASSATFSKKSAPKVHQRCT